MGVCELCTAHFGGSLHEESRLKILARAAAHCVRETLRWGCLLFFLSSPFWCLPYVNLWIADAFSLPASHPGIALALAFSLTVQVLIAFQFLLPILVLMLLPHERIRDPKMIIRYGEKFRDHKLTTPDFLVVTSRLWPAVFQGLFGFLSLPRPFQAVVLLKKSTYEKLDEAEFSFWIHRITITGEFQIQGRLIFWSYFFATLAWHGHGLEWILAGVGVLSIFVFSELALDRLMILSLEGLPSVYWQMLRKVYGSWLTPRFRTERYFDFSTRPWTQKTHWLPALAVVATLTVPFQSPHSKPVENPITESALFLLIEKQDEKALARLLQTHEQKSQLQMSSLRFGGATPVLWAAKTSSPKVLYLLLQQGGSLAEKDALGRNALFYALENPQGVQMLNYLLLGKWDLKQTDSSGQTILDLAIQQNKSEVVDLLLKKDPSLKPETSATEHSEPAS